MANMGFINVNPTSGKGNTEVQIVPLSQNEDRDSRSLILEFRDDNGICTPQQCVVTQLGKGGHVILNSFEITTQPGVGGNFIISGKSNAKALVFELGNIGGADVTLSSGYRVGGGGMKEYPIDGSIPIDNDPGLTRDYFFTLPIVVGNNNRPELVFKEVIIYPVGEFNHKQILRITVPPKMN